MIKDVFTLKKNSWHASMMKYIWNLRVYDFSYMCPYFWLSVFNLVIIFPVFLAKLIKKFFGMLGRGIINVLDKLEEIENNKFLRTVYNLRGNPSAIRKFVLTKNTKDYNRAIDYLWFEDRNNSNLYDQIRDDKKEILRLKAQKEIAQKQADLVTLTQRRIKINKINKVAAPVGKILVYLISGLVVLGALKIFYIIGKLLLTVKVAFWLSMLTYIVIGLISIGTLCIVILLIISLMKLLGKVPISFKFRLHMNDKTSNLIDKGFDRILSIYKLIYLMFKNNCPAIKWED